MGAVLIIEDDADTTSLLAALARELRCDATCATTCEEALRIMANQRFDLVLLDNQMCGTTGIDLLAKVKSHTAVPPIVFFSADDAVRSEALASGADRFVLKGTPNGLLILAELLEKYAGGSHH